MTERHHGKQWGVQYRDTGETRAIGGPTFLFRYDYDQRPPVQLGPVRRLDGRAVDVLVRDVVTETVHHDHGAMTVTKHYSRWRAWDEEPVPSLFDACEVGGRR